jgi:hypothetical protein
MNPIPADDDFLARGDGDTSANDPVQHYVVPDTGRL